MQTNLTAWCAFSLGQRIVIWHAKCNYVQQDKVIGMCIERYFYHFSLLFTVLLLYLFLRYGRSRNNWISLQQSEELFPVFCAPAVSGGQENTEIKYNVGLYPSFTTSNVPHRAHPVTLQKCFSLRKIGEKN